MEADDRGVEIDLAADQAMLPERIDIEGATKHVDTAKRLEHEFSLREDLHPEWAIRPLALVENDGWPMLVLDDPGGEPLDRLIRGPMEMGQFLRLAVGLAGALRELDP
jgi:hypothetical protein